VEEGNQRGKYDEVVNKAKVTVIFEIKLNRKTPETPVFSVRDYDEGVFAREFTTHSFSQFNVYVTCLHNTHTTPPRLNSHTETNVRRMRRRIGKKKI
jgi:hypothetical protein